MFGNEVVLLMDKGLEMVNHVKFIVLGSCL